MTTRVAFSCPGWPPAFRFCAGCGVPRGAGRLGATGFPLGVLDFERQIEKIAGARVPVIGPGALAATVFKAKRVRVLRDPSGATR